MATRIIESSPRHAAAARVYGSIIMPTGGLAIGTTPVRIGRADVAASASTIASARPNTNTDAATPNRTRGAGTFIRGRLPAPVGCKTTPTTERSIRMRGPRAAGAIVACLAAAIIGGACSSGGSSNGDKAAFCTTNADISAKLSNVSNEAEVIGAFKSVENQFDSYVKNAPSEVKADAQKQVDAARKAIKDNNASQFQTDQDLQKPSEHVDSFCGLTSSSS